MRRIALFLLPMIFMTAAVSPAFDFSWSGKKSAATKKAEDLYRKAKSAYGSADYSNVIGMTTKAIKADPKFVKAYALRGKAKKDMGDVDGAFKDLNHAIELDPKLGEAYYIRGQVNEIMGEMDKAASDYKKGCAAGYRDACR